MNRKLSSRINLCILSLFSVHLQGERTLERSLLHHLYGVSLLYEIPFQGDDDPLEFLPREADYYLAKDRPYSSYSKLYSG